MIRDFLKIGAVFIAVIILFATLLFLLPGSRHEYYVELDGSRPESAEAVVCGRVLAAMISDNAVSGSFKARCDDSPLITLTYANGTQVQCEIGYVTHSGGGEWRFRISNERCVDLSGPV